MRKRSKRNTDTKRLVDIGLTGIVAIAAVSMTWAGLRMTDKAVETSARPSVTTVYEQPIPDDATVIVVDAGHGGFDGGAVGTTTGVEEAGLNLDVALMLSDELTARGYYVILTREDENALAETKSADMRIRSEIMRLPEVDIVVSIHMNKFGDSQISGPMVFYMKNSERGEALAEQVIRSICDKVGRPYRYANPEDLFVLREPTAPSIIVECGFLSNPSDEKLLCGSAYRKQLAEAIAEGIDSYIKQAVTPVY